METKNSVVTRFMDMHSGGCLKTPYTHIYIDQPMKKAVQIFKELFKYDPSNTTCECCGEDFVYEEYTSLEEATAYNRGCDLDKYKRAYDLKTAKISVENYFTNNPKIILIKKNFR
jgi:hypothetical protein